MFKKIFLFFTLVLYFILNGSFDLKIKNLPIENAFEGKVIYEKRELNSSDAFKIINYYIKNNKVRIDFLKSDEPKNIKISRIINGDSASVILLIPKLGSGAKGKLKSLGPEIQAKVRLSMGNERRNILGYECLKITTIFEETTITAWVTPEINFDYNKLIVNVLGIYEGLLPAQMLGLPLEVKIEDKANNSISILKALQVNPEKIPESVFKIPAGYQLKEIR